MIDHRQITFDIVDRRTVKKGWSESENNYFAKFYYILDGSAFASYQNVTIKLEKHHLYYIPAHTPVSLSSNEPFDHTWVHFVILEPKAQRFFDAIDHKKKCLVDDKARMANIFEEMTSLYKRDDNKGQMQSLSSFLYVLSHFLTDEHRLLPYDSHHPTLKKCFDIIDEDVSQISGVHELAKRVCCHPTYLSNLFSQNSQITLLKYINLKKIDLAKSLIYENTLSLGQISENAGFSDYFHFSRTFKRITGVSPKDFQSLIRNQL